MPGSYFSDEGLVCVSPPLTSGSEAVQVSVTLNDQDYTPLALFGRAKEFDFVYYVQPDLNEVASRPAARTPTPSTHPPSGRQPCLRSAR